MPERHPVTYSRCLSCGAIWPDTLDNICCIEAEFDLATEEEARAAEAHWEEHGRTYYVPGSNEP